MTAVAKITSKGQTTIPADIRAALQVGPGDKLAWEVLEAGVVQVRRVQPLDPVHRGHRLQRWMCVVVHARLPFSMFSAWRRLRPPPNG